MRRTILSVAVCLLAFASVSVATTILRYSLDEVRDRADTIFTGSVVSSTIVPVMNGQLSATKYVIEVDDVLVGAVGHTTTVGFLRGPDGAPLLEEGKRYLFFKTGHPNDTTVGWGQGLYKFETIRTERGVRTILVSGDGESLVLSNGKLARGPRVRVIEGHIVPEAVGAQHDEPPDTGLVPFNPNGPAPRRLVATQTTAAPAPAVYATFDDVKRFVVSGRVRNR